MLLVNNGIAKNTNRYHIDKAPVFKIADILFYWINRSGQSDYFKKNKFLFKLSAASEERSVRLFQKIKLSFLSGVGKEMAIAKGAA